MKEQYHIVNDFSGEVIAEFDNYKEAYNYAMNYPYGAWVLEDEFKQS